MTIQEPPVKDPFDRKGEYDDWLDSYRQQHQTAVDGAFSCLTMLHSLSDEDYINPSVSAEDVDRQMSEAVEKVFGHSDRPLGWDVRYPSDAMYLLTGENVNPIVVVADIERTYLNNPDEAPINVIHRWAIAKRVLEHTNQADLPQVSFLVNYSDEALRDSHRKALDGVEGWTDYYDEVTHELKRRQNIKQPLN